MKKRDYQYTPATSRFHITLWSKYVRGTKLESRFINSVISCVDCVFKSLRRIDDEET
jgi:hypothetical protein